MFGEMPLFLEEYLSIFMVVALFIALLLGYPVAFTLGGVALYFGLVGFGLDFFNLLPLRVWGIMTNFTLLAVPLFVFMGVLLERSGLAEDLLETMALLFGRMRGGMAVSVVIVGALLAASTGIVGATVVTMGLLALPTMLKRNYSPELATGVISSSGTLGQIIPPSIILVLLGDIMNISVGDLFLAAVVPGLTLVTLYIIWIMFIAFIRPEYAPAIPEDERASMSPKDLTLRVIKALLPPAALIIAVLGSIFMGIASPTESAAMGSVGALILTIANKRFSLKTLIEAMRSTTRLTCMIFIIFIGATTFGLVFRGLGGDELIREFMTDTPFGAHGALFMVMAVLFILGFFLDFIEITFIVIPIISPIMTDLGFDPIWFAILVAMNLQTSFLTPPFGFSLFYLKGVAPKTITTGHLYRGIIPFVVIQIITLIALIVFPKLATWLPDLARARMFG
ncbi:TRAP dicarboxylate transporter, DctM subunit, unknown substrate 6 [hydrothermal vent metagenome]|uniref:TRAP C4-dicarboxylate transport system permease DctM subunit domain-containing protein n=1 Tax=hydrothermal vent metagenome TaxID=652676 RepID=A0A3B1C5C4_9ZZZZ